MRDQGTESPFHTQNPLGHQELQELEAAGEQPQKPQSLPQDLWKGEGPRGMNLGPWGP